MSLVVDNLSVSYGKLRVLWNVSLEVNKGEIVTLVGSNGAGKSTLLRAIIGLVPPESGKIAFEGSEINSVRTHDRVRKGVAYVPEGRRLFYSMSVEENLLMGSKGDPKPQLSQILRALSAFSRKESPSSQGIFRAASSRCLQLEEP